jgi:hypothetical protein
MNPAQAEKWKDQVLDEIFEAFAESAELQHALIFKGARVLGRLLNTTRQSFDLDSNLSQQFTQAHPDKEGQRTFLENAMRAALQSHFENQNPVRYELERLSVRRRPATDHPQGWDAFEIRINVNDLTKVVRGFPALEIDVASPENLNAESVTTLQFGRHRICIYTLQRIGGEKLRAFLSSLPAYRKKLKKPGDAVRVKDLYDLAIIRRHHDLNDYAFWLAVGQEFRRACQSRFVDCAGMSTFQENWDLTRQSYSAATIPKDVPFQEAETTLTEIMEFLEKHRFLPFAFPMSAS